MAGGGVGRGLVVNFGFLWLGIKVVKNVNIKNKNNKSKCKKRKILKFYIVSLREISSWLRQIFRRSDDHFTF